jgi:predicted enzyme related to lactoylglutathione lyase
MVNPTSMLCMSGDLGTGALGMLEPRTEDRIMKWTLELVVVPVSDIDRAKSFYMERAGFDLNVDHRAGEDFRVVQLTPPGSACSIALMKTDMVPGSLKGLQICVSDIDAARAQLIARDVDVSEVFHFGAAGQTPGYDPQRADYNSFISFSDPDGNYWLVQEVKSRA